MMAGEDVSWDDASKPEDITWDDGGKPEVGAGEAFGRGAAQAFGLGYSPQLIAALKTGNMPGSENPAYLQELEKQKAATAQAWEQHPYIYGGGMLASAIPAAANAILAGPEEAAAAGAAGIGSRLLSGASNLGSLGGAGLRSVAGESAGLAPSVLRGAATVAENPLAQGAVMGSAEGDTTSEKLSGALAGAAGAYVAPAILGAAGSAAKALGSKLAPNVVDPIFSVLTGSKATANAAGNIAGDIGLPLPSATVSGGKVQGALSALDVTNSIPKAAAQHLSAAGKLVSDYAGELEPKDTGNAVRNAVQNWVSDSTNPIGFQSQMNQIYAPIRKLENTSNLTPASNLQAAVAKHAQSPAAQVGYSVIEPTLNVANQALYLNGENGGLTFAQMKALRGIISDKISWNALPGGGTLSNPVLQDLRSALTADMQKSAANYGGQTALDAFNSVNSNAAKLYGQRDSILKIVGNPDATAKGALDSGTVYNKIVNAAKSKGSGNISDLQNLQQVVQSTDPTAWGTIGKTYASNMAPDGNFSYKNFNKVYGSDLHDAGRTAIFGAPTPQSQIDQALASGAKAPLSPRDTFDRIAALGDFDATGGQKLGQKLDALASKAGAVPWKPLAPAGIAGVSEIAGSLGYAPSLLAAGLPLKAAGLAAAGTAAGKIGARNIASPTLPLAQQYAPSQATQIAGRAVKNVAPLAGASMAAGPGVGIIQGYAPSALQTLTNQFPSVWNPPGSAPIPLARKSGGRVSDRLVAAADRAKKSINDSTKPLLNTPDTHVAQALEIANKNI